MLSEEIMSSIDSGSLDSTIDIDISSADSDPPIDEVE